ncbi:hypothetical protein E8L99_02295 [Phreatobacter aquaticus]|uniref:Permease n=1 Tax=Phreatobacter aquaticus TaxID=2570229 RepID=A0A4D7QGX6_9HYPH|nr:hypothetical protein [Phreatobacter aquaticus]QCK84694.1 hypothetical protein E8L99_02295 [Phreatobacter aquaticus]
MIVLVLTFALWALVVVLGFIAWRRGGGLLPASLKAGGLDFVYLIPRLAIGIIGSGFLAALLPEDVIRSWLGPESGPAGLMLASLAGALTPGGPVVGFAIGSTALKSGAGSPAVVAYVTAWALFAVQRLFVWELPVMPARVVWLRVAASLPLPFLSAWGYMLLGGR